MDPVVTAQPGVMMPQPGIMMPQQGGMMMMNPAAIMSKPVFVCVFIVNRPLTDSGYVLISLGHFYP